MFILQITHPVQNFDGWKKTFDSDPLNRKQSGVKSHRVFRAVENPNDVVVELEFDSLEKAEDMQESLKQLWSHVDGKIIRNPQSKILETIESVPY